MRVKALFRISSFSSFANVSANGPTRGQYGHKRYQEPPLRKVATSVNMKNIGGSMSKKPSLMGEKPIDSALLKLLRDAATVRVAGFPAAASKLNGCPGIAVEWLEESQDKPIDLKALCDTGVAGFGTRAQP
ncbi:hypothetical protein K437DRAFT_160690 [Tilletiaria anomala UBC 951]|uniref:Uncharacterized protein n=1 Tax=Tilletiaria anomala (strain ATCC 24038 / CBS 436.72 / UBC 951) TaxID=1037660 RepID=A0A066VLZ7_TILAU|nr:uncharacterized protein K437DRAFT_160690 [Tilletiaria anomala UBC 951]KDN42506.1 hypothetical protein K437DRAFT_160690 [Tilletiaria anomala UBC 951]